MNLLTSVITGLRAADASSRLLKSRSWFIFDTLQLQNSCLRSLWLPRWTDEEAYNRGQSPSSDCANSCVTIQFQEYGQSGWLFTVSEPLTSGHSPASFSSSLMCILRVRASRRLINSSPFDEAFIVEISLSVLNGFFPGPCPPH